MPSQPRSPCRRANHLLSTILLLAVPSTARDGDARGRASKGAYEQRDVARPTDRCRPSNRVGSSEVGPAGRPRWLSHHSTRFEGCNTLNNLLNVSDTRRCRVRVVSGEKDRRPTVSSMPKAPLMASPRTLPNTLAKKLAMAPDPALHLRPRPAPCPSAKTAGTVYPISVSRGLRYIRRPLSTPQPSPVIIHHQ